MPTSKGGVLEVNGSPTDAAAGLIKKGIHEGLQGSGYKTLAEYDTPDWAPPKAQQWVSGQITRFGSQIVGVVAANDGTGGGAIAAFKAAGVNPVPPVTGNDATLAGTAADHRGRPVQHDLEAERDRRRGGGEGRRRLPVRPDAEGRNDALQHAVAALQPRSITAKNLKAEIVDKGFANAKDLCTDRYAEGCKKLGITN